MKQNTWKRIRAIPITGIVLTAIILITLIVVGVSSIFVDYEYDREIGSHLEVAKYTEDPSIAFDQIETAIAHARDEGLRDDDHNVLIFTKEENRIGYVIENLEYIQSRIEDVRAWYEDKVEMYPNNTLSLDTKDIFKDKMNAIQKDIDPNCLHDAWMIENHIGFYAYFAYFIHIILTIFVLCLFSQFLWIWVFVK